VNAGSYDITASGYTSGNYDIRYVPGLLTVDKAALAITAHDASKTYDGLAFGGGAVSYAGFVHGETAATALGGTLAYGGSSQGAVNAGSYGITASGYTSGNYEIGYVPGTLTVDKAALTVAGSDFSKFIDGVAYGGGNGVRMAGFVGGDGASSLGGALAYGGSAQGAIAVGDYGIGLGGLTASNYDIRYVDGVLHVLALPVPLVAAVTQTQGATIAFTGGLAADAVMPLNATLAPRSAMAAGGVVSRGLRLVDVDAAGLPQAFASGAGAIPGMLDLYVVDGGISAGGTAGTSSRGGRPVREGAAGNAPAVR
jgi:hypothetical protein